jgi:Uma2 family endonuclease
MLGLPRSAFLQETARDKIEGEDPSMSSASRQTRRPRLFHGQRLKQPEFHRRYELCGKDEKFELVGGIVYMASPLGLPHGTYHAKLGMVLGVYEAATPGVQVADNTTIILGEESEPQPDLAVRILTECGGQSRVTDGRYVEGAPEFVAEVSDSSRHLDLNQKRQDYHRAGVVEYLVLCVQEQELHWFHFPSAKEIEVNRRGVAQSLVLPGLWIHRQALLDQDGARLLAVLQKGTASRAHAAFFKRLQTKRRRRS